MRISIPLTVTAAAYSANQSVGGLITLQNLADTYPVYSGPVKIAITDVLLIDKKANAVPYDLVFFDSPIANSAPTDHVAFSIATTDLPSGQGFVQMSGLTNLGANGGYTSLSPLYKRLTLPAGQANGYAVLVTRGTPTYGSTSDVTLVITAERVEG